MAEIRRRDRLDQPQEPGRIRLPKFDPEVFGQWSEGIARYMGTAKFLVYMTFVILMWIAWNALAPKPLPFDPFPFMFLTLFLSLQASYSAPLILLAQNRQTDRDRIASEEDRRRAAMQKADTEYLAREIASLRVALGEVATRDFVRSELARLAEELDEQANRRQRRLEKATEKASEKAAEKAAEKKSGKPRKPAKLDEPIDGDSYDPEHAEPL